MLPQELAVGANSAEQQEGNGVIFWPAKAPGATLDYEFNWSGSLQEGEQIQSYALVATGVTIVGANSGGPITDGLVRLQLAAGTLGGHGIVTCTITTNSAPPRIDVETAILPIGEEPVSLDRAKLQLRVDHTADDDTIVGLCETAREHVEQYCSIRLMPTAVTMTAARFEDLTQLHEAPVQSIVALTYLDAAGAEQTLDPAVYEQVNVRADPLVPMIRLKFGKSWPAIRTAVDAVRVSAVAGYTVVPRPIILAMLRLITHWYDNRNPIAVDVRGTPVELPHDVSDLLLNYRR
jgi:uncharacterized phiE125 gp8 family phage protein